MSSVNIQANFIEFVLRYIESDDKLSLRGDKLKEAIAFDKENGYIPFFVSTIIFL